MIWTTINDFRLIKMIFFDYYCLRSFKEWNMPVKFEVYWWTWACSILYTRREMTWSTEMLPRGSRLQMSNFTRIPKTRFLQHKHWFNRMGDNGIMQRYGIRCCYGGKCCKRYSNREVDTCSYPSYIGHYQGIPYVVCWSTVTHKERPIDHICEVCHGNNGSLMSSVEFMISV